MAIKISNVWRKKEKKKNPFYAATAWLQYAQPINLDGPKISLDAYLSALHSLGGVYGRMQPHHQLCPPAASTANKAERGRPNGRRLQTKKKLDCASKIRENYKFAKRTFLSGND